CIGYFSAVCAGIANEIPPQPHMTETFQPIDLLAIVLAIAVLIGSANHLWVRLQPAIGMLLGALALSLVIVSSDHVFHLHVMGWFRGTLDSAHLPRVFLNGVL